MFIYNNLFNWINIFLNTADTIFLLIYLNYKYVLCIQLKIVRINV